jgi:hypothetical protein
MNKTLIKVGKNFYFLEDLTNEEKMKLGIESVKKAQKTQKTQPVKEKPCPKTKKRTKKAD